MVDLGNIALWIALLIGVWGTAAAFVGGLRGRPELAASAERSVYVVWGLLALASTALLYALLTHDFSVEYVAAYTSRNLPLWYTWSAFYAGQKGSLLFWAIVVASFGAVAMLANRGKYRELMPYVAGVVLIVVTFFVATMVFSENPFRRLGFTPADGNGLNPQLQNPGMTIHPPMLYLGYTSITIPFAFAIAALISGRLDTGWIHAIRKWTILSWLFLSCGIILGMWWAYVELGWGGYWAWDPVENASLLPWLTMSAFLHSVMIQEKRGMLKKWNLGLIIGSFLLSIFGTFITRSGVIASVHSFAQSSIGYFFLIFLVFAAVAGFSLLAWRWPRLQAESELESMVSREAAFLFNNLVLVTIAFSVLWGTLFPILSEWLKGTKVTVGPPFFNQVNVPLGLLLLLLTGVGPLIAWRKASPQNLRRQFQWPVTAMLVVIAALAALRLSDAWAIVACGLAAFVTGTVVQEFIRGTGARMRLHGEKPALAFVRLVGRNRRRYGGYVVHLGIVMMFVGFTGEAFRTDREATLRPGQAVEVRSPYGHTYRLEHQGVSQYEQLNRFVSAASVDVYRDGRYLGVMKSEKRQHVNSLGQPTFEPSTEVAIRSDLREDLYLVYAGSVQGTEEAVYRITITPLVWWVWYGGMVLVLGGLVTMWPGGGGPTAASRRRAEPAGYVAQVRA
ncbi:MAG TPA: heme lyase CcmF/NrfE family subunit [Gemmatimonadales bacterium]|nr:heme lyase CcmF/NrfE family subunit [Gemmatimonadales bacterium]